METVLGVLVDEIPGLANILHGWSSHADQAVDLVTQAEVLSDLTVQVAQPLMQIGTDGRTMAQAIEQATAEIVEHQLIISTQITPLSLVSFGRQALPNSIDPSASDDHPWSNSFAALNGSQPLGTGRVDELVELIRSDTASGRDSASRFQELNPLLGTVIGDSSPAAVASALSMLMNGVGASQLRLLFSNGHEAAFKKIQFALENGLSPQQAGLPEAVFPIEIVQWHDIDAERERMQLTIDTNWELRELVISGDALSPRLHAALQDRIERLHPNDPMRVVFDQVERGGYSFDDAPPRQRNLIRAHFKRADHNLQAQFDAKAFDTQLHAIAVPTLDQAAAVQPDGSLSPFLAIGAAASTVPQLPVSYLGSAYAKSHAEFDAYDVLGALNHVVGDEVAATAFFETLGADQVMHFVNRHAWDAALTSQTPFDPAANPLVQKLSIALGRASQHLDSEYATTLIETRPTKIGPGSEVSDPEWIFAYGDFETGFLLSAAATAVVLHGGPTADRVGGSDRAGITEHELKTQLDPRMIMIDRVVRAELGAEFVHELQRIDAVDSLVWADPPIQPGVAHHLSGQAWTPDTLPLVSHLIVQAAADDASSMALIHSAGSRIESLDLHVANGMSVVLASQLPEFAGAGNELLFLDAAENTFAAGAGTDVDLALRAALIDVMGAGYTSGEWEWYNDQSQMGTFAGRIDGRKFKVFHADAQLRDQAIENRAQWITGLVNTTGIVIGIGGAPLSGGASLGAAFGGAGVTAAGWIAPVFLSPADDETDFLWGTITEALAIGGKGRLLALVALAASGSASVPHGSFTARQTEDGINLYLDLDLPSGQVRQSWVVGESGENGVPWEAGLIQALDDAGARALPEEGGNSIGVVVSTVGDGVFSQPYVAAFEQEAGLRSRD